MPVRAGRLRHRGLIQRRASGGVDSSGQATSDYQDSDAIWFSFVHESGKEATVADQQQGAIGAKLRVRYRSDLSFRDRIRSTMKMPDGIERARTFEIAEPPEDMYGKHEFLDLRVTEIQE